MKNIFLFACLLISTQAMSQNMKPIAKPSNAKKYPEIVKVLAEDKTNEIKYQVGKFTCHNFSKTLYLQRSSLIVDMTLFPLEAIKEDWGNTIVREESTQKLPIYILTMWNEESGFFHSINAVLVKEDPTNLDSYVFVEPQTDEIFATAQDMYKHYDHYLKKTDTGKALKISIGIFSEFKFNGFIYQSVEDSLMDTQISF